ncbi:unnamed protein product [Lampetra fluviatilis]
MLVRQQQQQKKQQQQQQVDERHGGDCPPASRALGAGQPTVKEDPPANRGRSERFQGCALAPSPAVSRRVSPAGSRLGKNLEVREGSSRERAPPRML